MAHAEGRKRRQPTLDEMLSPKPAKSSKRLDGARAGSSSSSSSSSSSRGGAGGDGIVFGELERVFGDDGASLEVGAVALSDAMAAALDELELEYKPPIKMFGRTVRQQRRVRFFAPLANRSDGGSDGGGSDGGGSSALVSRGYAFSGQVSEASPMPEQLTAVLDAVNARFGEAYNGCLANRYHDGSEYIGMHSDDERGLGTRGVVAVVWGASRTFRVRAKTPGSKSRPIVYDFVPTEHPSIAASPRLAYVLWMKGAFQSRYTHEVPKQLRLRARGPADDQFQRTSLTFRHHTE